MYFGVITRIQEGVRRLVGDQSGITGLETAIVLIAFVVVAAVFAFTVLTTGLFTSEKAKETAMAGVSSAGGSLELVGAVIAGGDNIGLACRTTMAAQGPPAPIHPDSPYENASGCDVDWNLVPPTIYPHVQTLRFRLGLALDAEDVSFDPNQILVTYQDDELSELLTFKPVRTGGNETDADMRGDNVDDWGNCRGEATPHFCIRWNEGSDRDFMLEQGETVEILITCATSNDPLHGRLNPGDDFRIEVIHPGGSTLAFERRFPPVFRWVMNLG